MINTENEHLIARLREQLAKPKQQPPLFGLKTGPDRTELLRNAIEQMEQTNANDENMLEARGIYGELLNRGASRDLAKLLTLVTLNTEMGAEIDGLAQEVMQSAFALVPPKPQWLKDHEAAVESGDRSIIATFGWPWNNTAQKEGN